MKKIFSIAMVAVVLTTMLTGCTNTSTPKEVKTYKVGIISPLSWPAADYGVDAVAAYKITAQKFNDTHKDVQIQLVIEDGKCNGKDAASAAQKLINVDGVQAIVGELCSAASISAGEIAQANKIPMIAPASSAPELANVGDYVYRFRNDADVTKKLSNYLTKEWMKNIIVVVENTDYGVGYLKSFKADFSGNILEEKFQPDEKDFDIIAKKVAASDADAVVMISSPAPTTISLVKAFDRQGVLTKFKGKIFGTEVTVTDATKQELGNLLEGIKVTQLVTIDGMSPTAQKLASDFAAQFEIKSAPVFVVLEAEATNLVFDAIVANGYNATAIKQYFDSFNAAHQRKWYFGDYYFSPKRDAVGLNFLVYEEKNGKLQILE